MKKMMGMGFFLKVSLIFWVLGCSFCFANESTQNTQKTVEYRENVSKHNGSKEKIMSDAEIRNSPEYRRIFWLIAVPAVFVICFFAFLVHGDPFSSFIVALIITAIFAITFGRKKENIDASVTIEESKAPDEKNLKISLLTEPDRAAVVKFLSRI
jgi:Na+/H+ antiporter NhaC